MSQTIDEAVPALGEGLHEAERLHHEGRLEDALAVLHRLRVAYPGSPDAPARAVGLMLHLGQISEAEPVIEAGQRSFPTVRTFFVYHAVAAERRREWEKAAARWAEFRGRFPDAMEGYLGGGVSLRELGQYAEADSVLLQGMARLPEEPLLFTDYAQVAERQRDWRRAVQRWTEARARFPDAWRTHVGLAVALRNAGHVNLADVVSAAIAARWPEQLEVLIEHARIAEARSDWTESATRWRSVRRCDPDYWPAYVDGAAALSQMDRQEDAGQLLIQAVELFPGEPTPAIRLARWRDAGEEWQASLPLWLELRRRAPGLPENHVGAAAALRMLGRHGDAREVLAEARGRFSDDRDVIREQVNLAFACEDWKEAAAACTDGARLFPDDAWFPRVGFEINVRLVDASAAVGALSDAADARSDGDLSDRERVMKFESLGGTGHGCEFGIYQRSHGAEPLGLLRWNDLNQEQLIDALESEFHGVGAPDQTAIFIPETKFRPQYWSRDKRFYMVSSTHVFVDEVPEEKLFPQLCRRLQYLRRKLIEDLRAGEKIFVYKNMFRNLTEAELDRLYEAMRRFGDNTLLYLCYADPNHPDGTVEWQRPGLMLGYVARFTHAPDDTFLGLPNEMFDRVTRKAYALWASGRTSVG